MRRVWAERGWVVVLIGLTLMVSLSQTILYAWGTPPGTVYPLVHNFVEDYYQYLDILRQGYDGWWMATSRLTPEVYPRMFVSVFLLFLGHAARWLHISLPAVYTGARVLGAAALMTLVYQLIRRTFPQSRTQRLIAFCFVLFGTYWWGWSSGVPTTAPLTHAWTELDPIFRWSFVPHHLWSKVGMLVAFLFLLASHTRCVKLVPRVMFSSVVVFMGFTNPVVYATFVPTLALYLLLSFARGGLVKLDWRAVGAMGIAALVLLYHRYLQMNIFPWTSYLLWEQSLVYQVNPLDYAQSLGPTLVLFVLAIPVLWRLGRIGSLYLAWAASSWLMLYVVGPFVPVTPERYLGGYQFIPLGIGAAVFIFSHKRLNLLWLGVVFILLGYFVIGIYASLTEHTGYVVANRTNSQVYVPKELMAAFLSVSQNSNPEDIVMAPYEISTMIPGFTGRRVVAGHAMFTKDIWVKRVAINEFFASSDPQVAKGILSRYNVRWILADASWIPLQDINIMKRYSNQRFMIYFRQ